MPVSLCFDSVGLTEKVRKKNAGVVLEDEKHTGRMRAASSQSSGVGGVLVTT